MDPVALSMRGDLEVNYYVYMDLYLNGYVMEGQALLYLNKGTEIPFSK